MPAGLESHGQHTYASGYILAFSSLSLFTSGHTVRFRPIRLVYHLLSS